MNMKNHYGKKLLLVVAMLVISLAGFSFAWFNYSKTSVGGKVINGIKFAKASVRALAKPNILQKISKATNFMAKTIKSASKIFRNETN